MAIAMMLRNCLLGLFVALSACAVTDSRKAPPAGLVEAGPGGAAGFQHGIERSRFVLGTNARSINEFGFSKLVGSEGTFAVSNANGAVVALQHARSAEQQKQIWYSGGHEEHSKAVLAYFVEAGIPRDQIASIQATTSADISGATDGDPTRAESRIRGWQSVLRRSVGGVPIVDSVAWARLNDDGKVLAEWVYWPAIPGKVIEDAKQFRARLSENNERVAFLTKLPKDLPPGQVVIRHSSAPQGGTFEAVAIYDVIELRGSSVSAVASTTDTIRGALIVRHFDTSGNELKLPQERADRKDNYPPERVLRPGAAAAP